MNNTRNQISTIVYWLIALFLFSMVLDGPLRYLLSKVDLTWLIYLPKALMLLALPLLLFARARISRSLLIVVAIIITQALVLGLTNLPSPEQPLFGLWVLTPLMFGLLVSNYVLAEPEVYSKLLLVLVLISITGVLINPIINYPWVGQYLNIGGFEVTTSRNWAYMGFDRYPGFSRASFSAASQILLFSAWLVTALQSKVLRVLLWLSAGVAIAMTTSKGALGAWIMLGLFFGTKTFWGDRYVWRQIWLLILILITVSLITLPISTLFFAYNERLHGSVNIFLFQSFGDRLSWTWPQSMKLLSEPIEWFTGRGLGGIGAPQEYFERAKSLPADNLFVYLCVDIGPIASILLLMYPLIRIGGAFLRGNKSAILLFLLLLILFSYGMVMNIIEESLLSFILGLCLSIDFKRKPQHQ